MYWLLFFLMISGGWLLYPTKILLPEEPKEIPFEQFYLLDTEDEPEESEDLKKLGVVEETTPEGIVRMKWEDDLFLYWSNRSIQYKYLETVARKYVLVYNCKEKYIQLCKNINTPVTPKKEQIKPAVFASFKQYNTKRNQINDSDMNKKTNQYTWKGKISEYERAITPEIKPIRYSDFKKM